MPFQIIRNDITKVTADAIVNTANPRPVIGAGTDSAIYQAAGADLLLADRQKIGDITPGDAAVTPAFGLNAKYIIHTVGPAWIDGDHGERETLHSCYENSLALAAELSCQSIAFPLIATGVYGFPKDEALDIALGEIGKFLLTHEIEVTLVVFDKKAFELSEKLVGGIEAYIDEHAAGFLRAREYGIGYNDPRRRRLDGELMMHSESIRPPEEDFQDFCFSEAFAAAPKSAPSRPNPVSAAKKTLDELLKRKEDTFQQRLFKLIDKRGLDDVTVYKRANIDRKVFSKIRCNVDYKPKKKTAVAFAIALELDMPEMEDLLSRAEYAMSPHSEFDLIISYFVNNHNYDIYEINSALFKYGQPLLGY